MPPDNQFTMWTAFQPILSDPILLVGMLLPFFIVAVLLYQRVRLTRRLTAMSNRNARAIDENAARWQESAVRSDRMIALLTEIRDHMAKIAAPDAPAGAALTDGDQYQATNVSNSASTDREA